MIFFFNWFFIIGMLIFVIGILYMLFKAVVPVIVGAFLIGGIVLCVVLARKVSNHIEDSNDYTPERKDDYWCN